MMPAGLEKWTKKILKLISVDGNAVLCNFKSLSIAEWNSQRGEGNQDVETFFGFQVTQEYAYLKRVCKTWLLAILLLDILESWIQRSRFFLQKESVGPEMVNRQRDFLI